MSSQQHAEILVSPSIAIEFTSKSIAAFYENELYESINSSDNAIDFKTVETLKVFKTRLQELRLPEKVKGQKDTFWTIGIPDNTSQEARKLILKAVEDFRRQPPTPPNSDIAYIDGDEVSKTIPDSKDQLPPPPIRLINRSTAGAISYLQSLRDGERATHDSDYDIGPYLPDRHFMVIIIDEYFVYGAQFKTIDGVVQHKKSYSFEKELFEKVIKRHENSDEEEEHRIRSLKSLWAVIISDGIQAKNKNKFSKMSVVFTYNTKSYIIKNSEFDPIPEEFVYSPADKFSHFPSINGNAYQWPHPEKFILKGINVKSRMLAGDADMVDYDVPSGFIGEALIGCNEIFTASLIIDGEKLPIKRTIFEAENPIEFYINFKSHGFYKGKEKIFSCNVDENGIIDVSQLKIFNTDEEISS